MVSVLLFQKTFVCLSIIPAFGCRVLEPSKEALDRQFDLTFYRTMVKKFDLTLSINRQNFIHTTYISE